MNHSTCDGCGGELLTDSEVRYEVRIEVKAAYGRHDKGLGAGCPRRRRGQRPFPPHGLLYEFGDLKPSFLHPPEPAVNPFLAVQVEEEEGNVTPCSGRKA